MPAEPNFASYAVSHFSSIICLMRMLLSETRCGSSTQALAAQNGIVFLGNLTSSNLTKLSLNGFMDNEDELDPIKALGANPSPYSHRFGIYVPSHDKDGVRVFQEPWVDELMQTLSAFFGGATCLPPAKGLWRNPETGVDVADMPLRLQLREAGHHSTSVPSVRALLHKMGRETNQGEVAGEIDNEFFTISSFDGA